MTLPPNASKLYGTRPYAVKLIEVFYAKQGGSIIRRTPNSHQDPNPVAWWSELSPEEWVANQTMKWLLGFVKA